MLWTFVVPFVALMSSRKANAILCHDCSSWNPYCREQVDEPFESAVATVECTETNTCFLKKDESGVVNRGCADWWMESQVNIHYVGCQTQHVPWLGEMTWCFCKQDYCNGGSIDMMKSGVYPGMNVVQDKWGDKADFNLDWNHPVSENVAETKTPKENSKSTKLVQAENTSGKGGNKGNMFDDIKQEFSLSGNKVPDAKYQLWFWHADSDRPHWEKEEESWRAPDWVENRDGNGWDFPVAGDIHEHNSQAAAQEQTLEDEERKGTTKVKKNPNEETTTTWKWGFGWAHIKPWWLRDNEDTAPTEKPRPWTSHPERQTLNDEGTTGKRHKMNNEGTTGKRHNLNDEGTTGKRHNLNDEGTTGKRHNLNDEGTTGKLTQEDAVKNQQKSDNSVAEGKSDVETKRGKNDVETKRRKDNSNENIDEINREEFFCWDCYSDSPLCGKSVDIVKAAYLGKSACSVTSKCFVRRDEGVTYRGCADGWTNSVIDTNYVGCRVQQMLDREVEWCFCTASLCNGDSMETISSKYTSGFEPYKKSVLKSVRTTTSQLATAESTEPQPEVSTISATRDNSKVRVKRLTLQQNDPKSSQSPPTRDGFASVDFHVGMETGFSLLPAGAGSTAVGGGSKASVDKKNWKTLQTSDESGKHAAGKDEDLLGGREISANLTALFR